MAAAQQTRQCWFGAEVTKTKIVSILAGQQCMEHAKLAAVYAYFRLRLIMNIMHGLKLFGKLIVATLLTVQFSSVYYFKDSLTEV